MQSQAWEASTATAWPSEGPTPVRPGAHSQQSSAWGQPVSPWAQDQLPARAHLGLHPACEATGVASWGFWEQSREDAGHQPLTRRGKGGETAPPTSFQRRMRSNVERGWEGGRKLLCKAHPGCLPGAAPGTPSPGGIITVAAVLIIGVTSALQSRKQRGRAVLQLAKVTPLGGGSARPTLHTLKGRTGVIFMKTLPTRL